MEAARSWKLHGDAQLQLGGAEEAARASAALPIFSRPFDAFKREHTCFCGDALSVNNAFSAVQKRTFAVFAEVFASAVISRKLKLEISPGKSFFALTSTGLLF